MFAEVKNGAVVTFPYDYDILVAKNPYTKFAQTDLLTMYVGTEANLNGCQLVRVTELDAPTVNSQNQKAVVNSAPTFSNNVWTLGWSIEALTQAEQAAKSNSQAAAVRKLRGEKLAECDWTQVADAPVDKTAWATYRQALRDITAQAGFPWTIDWPEQP